MNELKYKLLSFIYWVFLRVIYLPKEILEEMTANERRSLFEKRYPNGWVEWCLRCEEFNPNDTDECGPFKGGGTNATGFRYRKISKDSNFITRFLFKIRFFVIPPEFLNWKLEPSAYEENSHYFDSMSSNWHLTGCGFSICQGCYESIDEYGNRITIYTKDNNISITADGEYIIRDYDEVADEFRDEIEAIQSGERVVRSSAWRSTKRFDPDESVLVRIDSDIYLDGHGSEHRLKAKNDLIKEACEELDIVLFFVSSHTSNVCSRNIDYFIRTENLSQIDNVMTFIDEMVSNNNSIWNTNIIFQSRRSEELLKQFVDLMNEQLSKVEKLKDFNKKQFWELVAKNPKEVMEKIQEITPFL